MVRTIGAWMNRAFRRRFVAVGRKDQLGNSAVPELPANRFPAFNGVLPTG